MTAVAHAYPSPPWHSNTNTHTSTRSGRRMTIPPPTTTTMISKTMVTITITAMTTITATQGHGHSHGLIDRSIVRSREGVKAVALSLAVLAVAAFAQPLIFIASGSVALLADLIHNFGDALTAIPLGIAFLLRSFRGEKLAGLAVVAVIFFSACVAFYEPLHASSTPRRSPTYGCSQRPV